jgi:hypothetical protein
VIRERQHSSDAIHDAIADGHGYDLDTNVASRLKVELLRRHVRSARVEIASATELPFADGAFQTHGLEVTQSHAFGFTDQWKDLPLAGRLATRMGVLDRALHGPHQRDLDYRISNTRPLFGLANRWNVACRKVR